MGSNDKWRTVCQAPRCRAFAGWRILTPFGDRLHACGEHVTVVMANAGTVHAVVEVATIARSGAA